GKRDARILCLEERIDPRNSPYYWYDFKSESINAGKGTDIEAILEGDISITPLKMDHTDTGTRKQLSALFG
ncbi:MAG: 5'/3'-nucleotidase SurE, partial [Pseudomonadota bacterium]|nr:5'/3'-nucleotidase SurE [Pseudomonadota bacterium]